MMAPGSDDSTSSETPIDLTTSSTAASSPDLHPYRAAWITRDLDAWAEALAPDIVMHSPVLRAPFIGRDVAIELFGVLFESIGDFRVTDELARDGSHAFFWRADYRGRTIEGTDLVRTDQHGKIAEITVMVRPLVNIAVFAAAIGPPLASTRGRVRSLVVQFLNLPLKPFFTLIDVLASRLIQRR